MERGSMKKIGLVGGLSWHSTIEYYRQINERVCDRLGGHHSAKIILESVDQAEFQDLADSDPNEVAAEALIVDAALRLEAAGASVIALCANGVHRFVPQLEAALKIPIVHIVDATAISIKKRGLKTVGVLGVKKTMEGDFYPTRLKEFGIDSLVPPVEDQATVHEIIMTELIHGEIKDSSRRVLQQIIERLHDEGAEGVVLGCTELPLILTPDDLEMPSFSTTEIHCEAIAENVLD